MIRETARTARTRGMAMTTVLHIRNQELIVSDYDTCGDDPTGVPGCPNQRAVWIEFDYDRFNERAELANDGPRLHGAAAPCHDHAARLRAGEDVWGERRTPESEDFAHVTVTHWRGL